MVRQSTASTLRSSGDVDGDPSVASLDAELRRELAEEAPADEPAAGDLGTDAAADGPLVPEVIGMPQALPIWSADPAAATPSPPEMIGMPQAPLDWGGGPAAVAPSATEMNDRPQVVQQQMPRLFQPRHHPPALDRAGAATETPAETEAEVQELRAENRRLWHSLGRLWAQQGLSHRSVAPRSLKPARGATVGEEPESFEAVGDDSSTDGAGLGPVPRPYERRALRSRLPAERSSEYSRFQQAAANAQAFHGRMPMEWHRFWSDVEGVAAVAAAAEPGTGLRPRRPEPPRAILSSLFADVERSEEEARG